MQKDRTYVCIDLKSFYASVECRERGLDPMTTNLVVADPERSDKTICLAVSPAIANVKHFFILLGKMFFTPYGKEFFAYPGKQIFTS